MAEKRVFVVELREKPIRVGELGEMGESPSDLVGTMSSERAFNAFGKDGLRWVSSFSKTVEFRGRERKGRVNNEPVETRW